MRDLRQSMNLSGSEIPDAGKRMDAADETHFRFKDVPETGHDSLIQKDVSYLFCRVFGHPLGGCVDIECRI